MRYSDEELVAGCRASKPALQRALYEQYSSRLFAICLRYCPNRMEAEDVLHTAMMKIFTKLDQYGHGSFEGWMKRITVRCAIDQFHARSRRGHAVSLTQENEDAPPVDVASAEADALSQLSADELRRLIGQLPEGARMVFNLHAVEGFDHPEIAQMLSISVGTSKSQLSRARQLLQAKIAKTHPHFLDSHNL